MQLRHIKLEDLKPATVNVRHGKTVPDVSDIQPSIKKCGILQPLLVRPNDKGFEVVAGRRRYFAVKNLQKDGAEIEPIPCAIMVKGDDAAAMEASLLENIVRLPMDPMQQYEAFAKLIKQGETIGSIAETFAITELAVKRTLALAGLLPTIKALYQNDQIDAETLRILTLASKAQQKEWLALVKDERAHAPTGHQLKRWLLGGDNIKTNQALFDLADYKGAIITDLFGDDDYFADPEQFWTLQTKAIEQKAQALKEEGWSSVVILERGQYFAEWEFEKTSKEDGGRVYIVINHRGEVTFHEGYITLKEARARKSKTNSNGEADQGKPQKPEITKAMQTYVELHRHALVRTELLSHPKIALRLTVAHMIAGSSLWQIKPEPLRASKPEIKTSVLASPCHNVFEKERTAILDMLGFDKDRSDLVRCNGDSYPTAVLFAKLLTMTDRRSVSAFKPLPWPKVWSQVHVLSKLWAIILPSMQLENGRPMMCSLIYSKTRKPSMLYWLMLPMKRSQKLMQKKLARCKRVLSVISSRAKMAARSTRTGYQITCSFRSKVTPIPL